MKKCERTGKEQFRTKLDAELKRSSLSQRAHKHRKNRFREEATRSYRCEFCGKWHLTSQAKRGLE